MAVDFANNHLNYFSRTASILDATTPRPMTCCLRHKSGGNAHESSTHSWFYNNNFTSGSPRLGLAIRDSSGNPRMAIYSNGYRLCDDNITLSTTEHKPMSWTWDTDNTVQFYYDGTNLTDNSRTLGGTATDGAALGTLTGSSGNLDIDGEVAEFALWDVVLGEGEILAYHAGFSPRFIRPASRVSYLSLLDNSGRDLHLSDWTSNGTLNEAVHPSVIQPASPIIGVPAAAAATVYPWWYYHR